MLTQGSDPAEAGGACMQRGRCMQALRRASRHKASPHSGQRTAQLSACASPSRLVEDNCQRLEDDIIAGCSHGHGQVGVLRAGGRWHPAGSSLLLTNHSRMEGGFLSIWGLHFEPRSKSGDGTGALAARQAGPLRHRLSADESGGNAAAAAACGPKRAEPPSYLIVAHRVLHTSAGHGQGRQRRLEPGSEGKTPRATAGKRGW